MDECTMNVHKSITYQVIGRYLAKSCVVYTYIPTDINVSKSGSEHEVPVKSNSLPLLFVRSLVRSFIA